MTIVANMTAAQIDEAVLANPALKADAVKILVERYSRKSTKGRLPRWKSVTKLAEYLGYTGEMKREPIAAFIETTITPDNEASWGMFRSFAYERRMPTEELILFDSRIHFAGEHNDEHLLRIGPFNRDDA